MRTVRLAAVASTLASAPGRSLRKRGMGGAGLGMRSRMILRRRSCVLEGLRKGGGFGCDGCIGGRWI